MAGDWLKIELSTPDKPEVWAIATERSIDPDAVVGKLLRVWAWFDQHSEKGNAPSVTKALLNRLVGVSGFCDSLINAGWMIESDEVISLPNFDRHNGNTGKSRSLTARRVSKHKEKTRGNDSSVTLPLPREEKRREEKKEVQEILSGKPYDTPKNTQECEAIDYLNHVVGRQFKHAEANIKLLRARLKEGATLAEVKRVIDVKAKEWLGTDSEQYLRPATLFNATKFNQYIGQCGKTSQEADMDAWLNDEEPPIFGEMDNALEGEFNEI